MTAPSQARVLSQVCSPVAITDETHPEIALALAGLAAMSPERRAQLESEWHG